MTKAIPASIQEQARLVCPSCGAKDIIRYGTRSGRQVYKCKPCDKKFTDNGALPGRKIPANQVGSALSLFFEGLSYRDIQRNMDQQFGFTPSTATLYEWVRDYTARGRDFLDDFKAETGDEWVADETVIKADGEKLWLWNVVDVSTRYLLATHVSRTRTIPDAEKLFREARSRAARKPRRIVTDGLRAYQEGIERVFGGDTHHDVSEGLRAALNNNLSERMQGTFKERLKVMRGLESKETAEEFFDGFTLYYNHLRPHSGLRGRTPARAADVPFVFQNWIEVAHLHDDTLETDGGRLRFSKNVFQARHGRGRL